MDNPEATQILIWCPNGHKSYHESSGNKDYEKAVYCEVCQASFEAYGPFLFQCFSCFSELLIYSFKDINTETQDLPRCPNCGQDSLTPFSKASQEEQNIPEIMGTKDSGKEFSELPPEFFEKKETPRRFNTGLHEIRPLDPLGVRFCKKKHEKVEEDEEIEEKKRKTGIHETPPIGLLSKDEKDEIPKPEVKVPVSAEYPVKTEVQLFPKHVPEDSGTHNRWDNGFQAVTAVDPMAAQLFKPKEKKEEKNGVQEKEESCKINTLSIDEDIREKNEEEKEFKKEPVVIPEPSQIETYVPKEEEVPEFQDVKPSELMEIRFKEDEEDVEPKVEEIFEGISSKEETTGIEEEEEYKFSIPDNAKIIHLRLPPIQIQQAPSTVQIQQTPQKHMGREVCALIRTILWLVGLGTGLFFLLKSIENVSNTLSETLGSLKEIEIKTPYGGSQSLTSQGAGSQKAGETAKRLKELEEERDHFKEEVQEHERRYNALSEEKKNLESLYQQKGTEVTGLRTVVSGLDTEVKGLRSNNKTLEEEIARIKSKVIDLPAGETLSKVFMSEITVESLSREEQDHSYPTFSNDASSIMYIEEKLLDKGIRKILKTADIAEGRQISKPVTIFEASIAGKDKINTPPFIFDWDGNKNIALLTRIEGEHAITFLRLSQSSKIECSKVLFKVHHPQVLGPPAITTDGKRIAFIHRDGEKVQVKVYNTERGDLESSVNGVSGTMMVPAWSPDGSLIAFPGANNKEIVVWDTKVSKSTIQIDEEIYGRYMSWSPAADKIAFFRRCATSKGRVELCVAKLKDKKWDVDVLIKEFLTVETCMPAWNPSGSFLGFLESGTIEVVWIADILTKKRAPLFQNDGRVEWISWSNRGPMTFTYKQGLFSRPYLVTFSSIFTKTTENGK